LEDTAGGGGKGGEKKRKKATDPGFCFSLRLGEGEEKRKSGRGEIHFRQSNHKSWGHGERGGGRKKGRGGNSGVTKPFGFTFRERRKKGGEGKGGEDSTSFFCQLREERPWLCSGKKKKKKKGREGKKEKTIDPVPRWQLQKERERKGKKGKKDTLSSYPNNQGG